MNTLSTISNLLRHSGAHVTEIIDCGLLNLIMELFAKTTSTEVVTYVSNLLKKAVKYQRIFIAYPRQAISEELEKHIKEGRCDATSDPVKTLRGLLKA